MMLTVQNIPDLKPQHQEAERRRDLRYIDDDAAAEVEDKNIPYHARQSSQPFSYGVDADMIADPKAPLSSPGLVRKASVNRSTGDTLKKVQTRVFDSKPVPNFANNNNNSYKSYERKRDPIDDIFTSGALEAYKGDSLSRRKDPIDDIFTSSARSALPIKRDFREEYYKEEVRRYDPLKRSLTEGTIRRSPEKIGDYKVSNSTVTSPYSDSESLSPPGAFRNNTKSPEFHET